MMSCELCLLPTNQRYEIIFLSQHLLSPKCVLEAVKCSTSTIQIDGNSQQISMSQIHRTTTQKQKQQIVSLDEQQTFVTSRDKINDVTIGLCQNHQINRFQWTQ